MVCFARWGCPRAVRVDNGSPWGSWNDFPPALALWLIGCGIAMIWNPPRRPQCNGVVERSQGTAKRWAEPGDCTNVAELQSRLDADDLRQREVYPYAGSLSRIRAWPGLAHSGRDFVLPADRHRCDFERVLRHLSDYRVSRRVSTTGTVSLWNRSQYIGKAYVGQTVWIRLDPEEVHWLFDDEAGRPLRAKPARELTPETIRQLQITGSK
jgi:hypothetical protein